MWVFYHLQLFGSAITQRYSSECGTYHRLKEEIDRFRTHIFFHENIVVMLMESRFVLSHQKFRIGANMITINNFQSSFMNKVHY